jgi:hypothetical protein
LDTVTEYGCKQCGGKIMKPSIVPLLPDTVVSSSSTTCDDCGFETNVFEMCGFQCSPQIHSRIQRICTTEELKQLRLDPKNFLSTLNRKSFAAGKPELEIDTGTELPTIKDKVSRRPLE